MSMDPDIRAARWPEIEALLDAALDLAPGDRASLLEDPLSGDAEIRAEVKRLLALAEVSDEYFAGNAAESAWSMLVDGAAGESADPVRSRAGPYRIVREIGRGGMGAVYLAERDDEQFTMQVALKLVPRGMDSGHALRRFREERQILAGLEHPHIARLLDGGVTEDGLPWFALEYVEGEAIDRYCDSRQLSIDARLELFCKVCDAVQFAHRNLVVHRDIKPANILVTGEGVPKLLDFGIAKLVESEESGEAEPLTRTGMRLLTPEYASPEQVRGETITTATDVYSLGVLLYELLTGRLPYHLSSRSLTEIERAVCDTEPVPPSTSAARAVDVAAASAGDAPAATSRGLATPDTVSRARGTTPGRLRQRLHGDLDTIVLMALRKEPERRYASAEQLLADVRRHLDGLPVSAQRNTRRYRSGKFLKRHRAGVVAAALLVLSLIGGMAGTVWQARQARLEADRAEQVKNFLIGVFEAESPEVSLGHELTARELLVQGTARIDAELAGQPAMQAELLSVLASTYLALGLANEAKPLADRALSIRQRLHGARHPDVAASRNQAARILLEQGDFDAAESELREVLALTRSLRGRWHGGVAQALNDLAAVMSSKGEYDEAEQLYREALGITRRLHGNEHLDVATALSNLGVLLWKKADYDGAEASHREALALRSARLDADHPDVATSMFNLATVRDDLGDPEAEALFRDVLERRRRIYRNAHPVLAMTIDNLSGVLSRRGEFREAEVLAVEALDLKRRLHGDNHSEVAITLNNIAVIRYRAGDLDAAARDMREALRVWRNAFGSAHPNVASALNNLGGILNETGDHHSAEPLLIEALSLRRDLLGGQHPDIAQTLRNLGISRHRTGNHVAAEPLFVEALSIYAHNFPDGHVRTAETLLAYALLLIDVNRATEAEPMLEQALATRRARLPEGDTRIAQAAAPLVKLYDASGRKAEADTLRDLLLR